MHYLLAHEIRCAAPPQRTTMSGSVSLLVGAPCHANLQHAGSCVPKNGCSKQFRLKYQANLHLSIWTLAIMDLGLLRMASGEDPLVLKNSKFVFTTSKTPDLRLTNEKQSIVSKWMSRISGSQLIGYLLSILAWIMCIASTASERWRVWKVKYVAGIPSGLILVGIWKVCFMYGTSPENVFYRCEEFTENYKVMPKEIFLAQDLMTLGCALGAVASSFMSFALWNVFKPLTHKDFLLVFFNLGAVLNIAAGVLIFIPISLNLHSVLIKAGIVFPDIFQLPVFPIDQHVGAAIYIGYIAAGLYFLSGSLILSHKCVWNMNKSHFLSLSNMPFLQPTAVPVSAPRNELCSKCSSSVAFHTGNIALPESCSDELFEYSSSKSIPSESPVAIKPHPVITVTPCK